MNLQLSPNRWSCLPTAFAIALNIPVSDILNRIGHNGDTIVWPDLPEPQRRIGFHIQELIDVSYDLGYYVIQFQAMPHSKGNYEVEAVPIGTSPEVRLTKVMKHKGVITGTTLRKSRHAVAWDGEWVYDPNGDVYSIENFVIETFWMIKEVTHDHRNPCPTSKIK